METNSLDKTTVLRNLTFGARIAEDEVSELSEYFVETDQWSRMYAGDLDVVYGAKGSGKSAIYALLLGREGPLFDRGILLAGAEDPRGAPVFGQLVADPPTSELEFSVLWKLYFLSLIGRQIRDYKLPGHAARRVVQELERADLLEDEFNLRRLLRAVLDYGRAALSAESFEAGVKIDSNTGMPSGFTGKITLREPNKQDRQRGLVSVDEVFELANEALAESQLILWLVLDRLDVAFSESGQLEANALRALFRMYGYLRRFSRISLKVFLRSDIWKRITEGGFREASHITKDLTITWNTDSLLNLVVRRLLNNHAVTFFYREEDQRKQDRDREDFDEAAILLDANRQRHFFYRVFPRCVDETQRGPETFDWILSLIRDGSGAAAPRELIHILNAARDAQLRRLEMGHGQPSGELLFDIQALRQGLREVSRVRLQQTLYAEYPQCSQWISQLAREGTEFTNHILASIWAVKEKEAAHRAEQLSDIGLFARLGTRNMPRYSVPLLYRPALGLLGGPEWQE